MSTVELEDREAQAGKTQDWFECFIAEHERRMRAVDEAYRRLVEECADVLDDPCFAPLRRALRG